jgi:ABC-type nitrate/sulfonate/bicarbonate transport system substrate-binding protein
MNSVNFYPLYASAQSGVTSVEELKGKKIGVVYGTSLHYLTYKYLEAAGLSEDDVEIVQTTDIATLLLSGDIDAGVTTAMQGARLESEEATYLCDESTYNIRQESTLCVRTEFSEQYPELTAKFLKAIDAADTWINENPDEAAEIAANYAQYDVSVEQLYQKGNNIEVTYDETDIEVLTDIIKFLSENGMLADNSITLEDVLDLQYLELAGLR